MISDRRLKFIFCINFSTIGFIKDRIHTEMLRSSGTFNNNQLRYKYIIFQQKPTFCSDPLQQPRITFISTSDLQSGHIMPSQINESELRRFSGRRGHNSQTEKTETGTEIGIVRKTSD